MKQITSRELEKLDKKALIELCLRLANTTHPMVKSIRSYAKTIDDMANFCLDNNVVEITDSEISSEGELIAQPTALTREKLIWDKAKVIMKEMSTYHDALKKMEANLMPDLNKDASIIKEAPEGDITRFLD